MPKSTKRSSKKTTDPFDRFRTDEEFLKAAAKLDKPRFNDALGISSESLATYLNFESYKGSMQSLKANLKKLSPDVEAHYKERVEHAVKAYRTNLGAAETLSTLFSNSGFDAVLERHHQLIFKLTPSHPYTERISGLFRKIGATDADISHFSAQLRAKGWNPFRFGTNGKVSGLVQSIRDQLPTVEKELEAVKRHGVPIMEGAAPVVIVVVAMVAVGYFSCAFLNDVVQKGDCILPL